MQDVTPTPAGEPKQKNTFRGLFSRMAIGQCVHAALCVAAGAAIGLSAGRVSTALGIVLGILAAAIGAVVCALWFRRRVSRPVEQITEVTRTIAGGRYGTELPVQRDDELGRLATAINELSQEISRSEKMQSEFISSISHELRTPTTVILAACEDARKNAQTPADYQAALDVIDRQAHKMSALIRSMLEITRLDQGTQKVNWEYADLSDLVTVICDEQAMVARLSLIHI